MKVKIQLPESLREITLAQYQHFLERAKGLEENELKALMIECFCLIPADKVKLIERASVEEVCLHLDNLFIQEKQLVNKFELKGFKFGFVPDLDAMTFGEYVDLDKYIGDWGNMHRAMAVLFRPIGTQIKEEYTIVQYEGTDEYAELMKLMPLDVVLGAQVFFWNLGSELLAALPSYLEKEGRAIIQLGRSSGENGDGIAQSINSLEEMLGTLKQSLSSDFQQLLPTSLLKARKTE